MAPFLDPGPAMASHQSDQEQPKTVEEDIAIIGMACRFPGDATTPSKLWDMLVEGRSAWSPVPASKWNAEAHYHPSSERGGSTWVKGGHFLKDGMQNGKLFDAPFFGITRSEAMSMDLQQRLVMENVYEALENAGLRLEDVRGSKTSVFAGAFTDDSRAIMNEDPDMLLKFKPTGTSNSIISNRVSYFFDLRSTSLTLDTACSSSLVALALACQDLRSGKGAGGSLGSDMSIVTGVNVIESPETMYRMSNLGFLSPDGRCFSFDSRANGYSRGEGVGTVVLKPLSSALRDGDTIRAVIRGTGINQDGSGTGAMTLPNKMAQEALIRDVYARFGLDMDQTGFVEAHGTGTPAGDPLEAGAIASAFRRLPPSGKPPSSGGGNSDSKTMVLPLHVGAGKTNHGHLEGASGIAAVIKTVLTLENGVIPPNINFEKCNPRIPVDKWGIRLPLEPTPFEGAGDEAGIRRASINSFGFGGTNAHAVLDDAASYLRGKGLQGRHRTRRAITEGDGKEEDGVSGHRIFLFSAHDEAGVQRLLSTYADHLEHQQSTISAQYLSDLAYTLAHRRSRLPWRIAITADSHESLVSALRDTTTTKSRAVRASAASSPSLGFIFTGQGAQWSAMGRELFAAYPVFRDSVCQADKYLREITTTTSDVKCDLSVVEELLQRDVDSSRIDEPLLSQTLCTVLQVALVDLLASWAMLPKRVVGHSSGEIAAAYAAGALDRESTWRVAYCRGVVSSMPPTAADGMKKGAMLALGCSADEVQPLFREVEDTLGPDGEMVIACYNSPKSLTISGDEVKIDALLKAAEQRKVFARKLRVGRAYHSSHMHPVADEYVRLMGVLKPSSGLESQKSNVEPVQVFSSVTGQAIDTSEMSQPEYWARNLVSPVRFKQAIRQLCTATTKKRQLKVGGGAELLVTHLVEIGPHGALHGAVRDTLLTDPDLKALRYMSVLTRNKHACATALDAVAAVVAAGFPVDLGAVNRQVDNTSGSESLIPPAPPRMLTDLPPYPFNHTASSHEYWSESRRSKHWRFRKHARHDVLGSTTPDWNPQEPRWRNTLRVSELPWLKDHVVTGSIVVPGVTYLIMAIEGVRQLHEHHHQTDGGTTTTKLRGFNLRDISISRALQVDESSSADGNSDGTEIMLSMRRAAESAHADSSIWWDWRVTSYSPHDGSWLEHCRGQIAAELDTSSHIATGPIDAGRESREREEMYKKLLADARQLCGGSGGGGGGDGPAAKKSVEVARQYADLERVGLVFGPLFRNNVTSVHAADPSIGSDNNDDSGQALGTLTIPDMASCMHAHALSEHIVHPAIFDSIIHLFLFAFQASPGAGGRPITEPMVPVAIKSVWLGADIESDPGRTLLVHSSARMASHKRLGADITVWSGDEQTEQHEQKEASSTMGKNDVRLVLRGLEAVPLQETQQAGGAAAGREICFNLEWAPDVDILDETGQTEVVLRKAIADLDAADIHSKNIERLKNLQLAAAIYISEAVEELDKTPLADESALATHQRRYLAWLRRQADLFGHEGLIHQDATWKQTKASPEARQRFLEHFESNCGPEGRLTSRMGRNIVPGLRRRAAVAVPADAAEGASDSDNTTTASSSDPLYLMFGQDDLLEEYYRVILGTEPVHGLLGSYIRLLSHKRGADLRVLEIGAGTGGTSTCVLTALCPEGGSRVNGDSRLLKYTYTDISAGFFEKAAVKFAKWKSVMEFRVLDVEKDVEQQGFEEGGYDVIVAANVLHATADLSRTLGNVRRLLSPGGKLLLQEITQPEFIAGPLCFGQLPGWWLSTEEEMRAWGPLLSNDGWVEVLRGNGFRENVLPLSDTLDEGLHAQSLIIATAPATQPGLEDDEKQQQVAAVSEDDEDKLNRVFIVARTAHPDEAQLAQKLADKVRAVSIGNKHLHNNVLVVDFADLPQHKLKQTCCIVTLELFSPLLASAMTPDEFEKLRHVTTTCGGLLWLTADPYENPDMALMTGLIRTLRWERNLHSADLVTLALPGPPSANDNNTAAADNIIDQVAAVYKHHFVLSCPASDRHSEYLVSSSSSSAAAYTSGVIQTNRLVASRPVNVFIAQRTTALSPEPQPLGADPTRSLMLNTSAPGRLDRLHFIDWPAYHDPLPADQIEVEIKATGLNFRDVMVAMGEVAAATFGHEGAGVVTKVGSGVTDVAVGDRMLVLSALHGTFQTHTRIPRDIAARIPDSMAFEEAAGIPVIFSTAWYCLCDVARLRPGETVLIHAAAGGVGQAAIQIAKNIVGAEVFATVSSPEKKKLLIDEYGIPESHIFSSRDLSFAAGAMRMTGGKGVDVILNSLAGEALRASFNCIATFGRFIEIGKRDIFANGKLDMFPFSRSVTFAACDLYTITKLDTKTTARVLSEVLGMFESGKVHAARPQTTYTFSQIEEAFRLLQQGKHMGKVVLTASPTDTVKVIPRPPVPHKLRPDRTYLLSGGLGGLGRSIARWMVHPTQGAKNILFLSRSGGQGDAAQELLAELESLGVRARALKCDISDETQLLAALDVAKSSHGFPPIGGVIQGAMQLLDSAFEFMPHSSWEATLAPKCRGTWNLHRHTPPDVDFFIMLSSICGLVGNRGQANYAAGNCFQDSLAAYRRKRGLAASTLDLGNILSVGYIAENAATLNANPLFFFAHDGVREDEFQSFVEFHLDRDRAAAATTNAGSGAGGAGDGQVAVGLATSADFRSRGLPEPTFIKTPLFAQLRSVGSFGGTANGTGDDDDDGSGGVSVSHALKFAENLESASALVLDALVRRLSRTMTIPREDIDTSKPIHAYGVDSLVAMEFRNYIASDCGYDIAVLDIMGNKSMLALSGEIASGSRLCRFAKKTDKAAAEE